MWFGVRGKLVAPLESSCFPKGNPPGKASLGARGRRRRGRSGADRTGSGRHADTVWWPRRIPTRLAVSPRHDAPVPRRPPPPRTEAPTGEINRCTSIAARKFSTPRNTPHSLAPKSHNTFRHRICFHSFDLFFFCLRWSSWRRAAPHRTAPPTAKPKKTARAIGNARIVEACGHFRFTLIVRLRTAISQIRDADAAAGLRREGLRHLFRGRWPRSPVQIVTARCAQFITIKLNESTRINRRRRRTRRQLDAGHHHHHHVPYPTLRPLSAPPSPLIPPNLFGKSRNLDWTRVLARQQNNKNISDGYSQKFTQHLHTTSFLILY